MAERSEILAERVVDGTTLYRLEAAGAEIVLTVEGVARFTWMAESDQARATALPGVDPGLIDVLEHGLVRAVQATLDGAAVLHGGAVEVDGMAVAVVGPSGTGKSTTTALLCAAGASLLGDDVLILDLTGGEVSCRRVSDHVRLRTSAAEIASLASATPSAATADGRIAVTPTRSSNERCPVRLVVLPRPTKDATAIETTRRPPAQAIFDLLGEPRVDGLTRAEHQRALFDAAAALSNQAPVVEMTVPWGPPWSREGADDLMAAVRRSLAVT
jgi:hypothetical protein